MKSKQITAYFCDHCSKLYQREHHCKNHEKKCKKNPNNWRACFGCNFCVEKEIKVIREAYHGEYEIKQKVLFCNKFEHGLIPPKAEHNKNSFDLVDFENELMPSECKEKKEMIL